MPASRKRRRHVPTVCGVAPIPLGDGCVGQAFGAGEDHTSPLDQGRMAGWLSGLSPLELVLLLVGERERGQFAAAWHGRLLCAKSLPIMTCICGSEH